MGNLPPSVIYRLDPSCPPLEGNGPGLHPLKPLALAVAVLSARVQQWLPGQPVALRTILQPLCLSHDDVLTGEPDDVLHRVAEFLQALLQLVPAQERHLHGFDHAVNTINEALHQYYGL